MSLLLDLLKTLVDTLKDVLPIVIIIFSFQYLVLRTPIRNWQQIVIGFGFVLLGLAFFLVGLEKALFPLGRIMAQQLTQPQFILDGAASGIQWYHYKWVYLFAAAIGFATTIAEPSLIAVAIKAEQVSGGAISVNGLRISVAMGVSVGIALGTFRIVSGTPLEYYIITGYVFVIIQTYFAPKMIVGLAYDSGGVTTSTVTVPLVTALGLGLASTVPGRSAILDGFGLIAFASLFPIISVMGYAQLSHWRGRKKLTKEN